MGPHALHRELREAPRALGNAGDDGIDLVAEAGEITCLIGPNGAGKTTVLRVVSGLIRPSRGSIVFGESGTVNAMSSQDSPFFKSSISFPSSSLLFGPTL